MVLVRERLKTAPSGEAIDLLYGPRLQNDLKDFDHMLRVHLAHTVMLTRQGIIEPAVGSALAGALLQLRRAGLPSMTLDPKLEDLFYNVEARLTAELGARVAGQLHTGRSRNDLGATIHRMHAREAVNRACAEAIALRRAILDLASQHTETVMPGYTHWKPAQPITFGYYLAGIASALDRDTRRVERAHETTNLSPLGAAALAGTSFPLDRQLTASLLGFDGLLENCLDAVASRDYAHELVAALVLLTTTLSRLGADLYVWQTDEFGMVELADAISGTSSIMPQKKNPHALENTRAKAGQVLGAFVACLASTKAALFSNNQESGRGGVQQFEFAIAESLQSMALMRLVMRNLSVDARLMADRANRDFSSVTDLADFMVRRYGISFREAHGIVGGSVFRAVTSGKVATDLTPELLNEEAREVLGYELDLDAAEVRAALDPAASVKGKLTIGGPAPDEVKRQIATAVERLTAEESRLNDRQEHLSQADGQLDGLAEELAGRGGA
jgi:argininosuccinate lyase